MSEKEHTKAIKEYARENERIYTLKDMREMRMKEMNKKKNIVAFHSLPKNFEKEMDGRKANTLRRMYPDDLRFQYLRQGKATHIQIIELKAKTKTPTNRDFIRKITDYTEWKDWAIISWKHEEE